VIQPNNVHLRTATELLEQVLARDATPQSTTTLHREQQDPAVRLGESVERYLDALHLGAAHLAGPVVADLDRSAERLLSGVTSPAITRARPASGCSSNGSTAVPNPSRSCSPRSSSCAARVDRHLLIVKSPLSSGAERPGRTHPMQHRPLLATAAAECAGAEARLERELR
jgi:hypothetical protein